MSRVPWLWPLLIVIVAAIVLIPVSPIYRPVPDVDQSVYLYVAERILEGEMPYRDVWDHKQPLTYLLYATGLAISGGTLWGIWALELVFLIATGLLAYDVLRRVAPPWLAFSAVAGGLLTLVILIWGYSVEELALPFQAAALACLARLATDRRAAQTNALSVLLGVLLALSFLLKQNLLAMGVAGLLVIGMRAVTHRERRGLRILALSAAGFAAVLALAAGWLAVNGALRDYYEAAFAFNLTYAGLGLVERLNAVLDGLEYISGVPGLFVTFGLWAAVFGVSALQNAPFAGAATRKPGFPPLLTAAGILLIAASVAGEVVSGSPGLGLLQTALIAAGTLLSAAGGLLWLRPRLRAEVANRLCEAPLLPNPESSESRRLLAFLTDVSALLFPLTVLLIGLSGRNYVYYFIQLVPVTMLLTGVAGGLLLEVAGGPQGRKMAALVILGLCAALAYNPLLVLSSSYRAERDPQEPEIAGYVRQSISPQDTILAWGKYTTYIYYAADRKAPTRFFYQAALAEAGYEAEFGVSREMLGELQANPPALFLVSFNPSDAGIEADICAAGGDSGSSVLKWMCGAYRYAGAVGEFQVYRHER